MRKMHPKKAAMYAVEEDSLVTLSMVYELLDQQQYFYKELVELQERNYKSFMYMLVDSTNGRVDAVVKELQDLKNGLQASRAELAEVRRDGKQTAKRAECLAEGLVTLRATLDAGLASKNGAGAVFGAAGSGVGAGRGVGGGGGLKPTRGCQSEPKAKRLVADLTAIQMDNIKVHTCCLIDEGESEPLDPIE